MTAKPPTSPPEVRMHRLSGAPSPLVSPQDTISLSGSPLPVATVLEASGTLGLSGSDTPPHYVLRQSPAQIASTLPLQGQQATPPLSGYQSHLGGDSTPNGISPSPRHVLNDSTHHSTAYPHSYHTVASSRNARRTKRSRRSNYSDNFSPFFPKPSPRAKAWTACHKSMRKHDEVMVKGWKEDIDTLLVFAGLFSAVSTAFDIEAYKLFQQDSKGAFSDGNATFVNVLWFSSLVLSLAAASIGILVKQWLRDYIQYVSNSPRQKSRTRQFRHQGLVGWHVPGIIAMLPVLLQLALAFFLIGLVDFLWHFDRAAAAVISILVSASLLFLVITTILPTIFSDSPHRSPQALAVYFSFQWFVRLVALISLKIFAIIGWSRPSWPLNLNLHMFRSQRRKVVAWSKEAVEGRNPRSWPEREQAVVRCCGDALDRRFLVRADSTFMDDLFLETVLRTCIDDTDTSAALDCLLDITRNRAEGFSQDGSPQWKPHEFVDKGLCTLINMVADILLRMGPRDETGILRILGILDKLCKATNFESEEGETDVLYRRVFNTLATLLFHEQTVRRSAFNIMRDLYGRSPLVTVEEDVIQSLICFTRSVRLTEDSYVFQLACSMALGFASADLPDGAYQSLRPDLRKMLQDLESLLTSSSSPGGPDLDNNAAPSPSLLMAVLDFADQDPDLVNEELIRLLNEVVTGTRYGRSGSQANSRANHATERAVKHLRTLYGRPGGSGNRRIPGRERVVMGESLVNLGLRLPQLGGEIEAGDTASHSDQ